MNYRYRIYVAAAQEQKLIEWMEVCRGAYKYALREIKDWCDRSDSLEALGIICDLPREDVT